MLLDLSEYQYSLIIILVCHLISMIPVVNSARNRDMWNICVMSLATLITSVCYHYTEVCMCTVMGMNDGKWHRLDNIFIICTVQMYVIYVLTGSSSDRNERSPLELLAFSVALVCQEIAPWDVRFTVFPILVAVLLSLIYTKGRVRSLPHASGLKVLLYTIPTVWCFHMGLDDEQDYLRLYHYGWHVGVSLLANSVIPEQQKKHEHLL